MLLAIQYISFQSKTALLPTSGLFIEFHCFEFNIKSTLSYVKNKLEWIFCSPHEIVVNAENTCFLMKTFGMCFLSFYAEKIDNEGT